MPSERSLVHRGAQVGLKQHKRARAKPTQDPAGKREGCAASSPATQDPERGGSVRRAATASSSSIGQMDRSACDQSGQENAVTRTGGQWRPASASQGNLQPTRLHHDDNNNNNNNQTGSNNGANGKVRLLIAPAAERRGSKQQFASSQAAIDLQQQRSHSANKQQQQQQRSSHNHYYDYNTDSDLASSIVASHYDENILLFATEHASNHNQRPDSNGNQQRAQRLAEQQLQSRYQQAYLFTATDGARPCAQRRPAGGHFRQQAGQQMGRFVNFYPSWRQRQSPAGGGGHNYSFHVPLNTGQQPQRLYQRGQRQFGFVAPSDRVPSRATFSQSFRSRTISHLPSMVRVSVEDSGLESPESQTTETMKGCNAKGAQASCYEDFYERASICQRMKSDGDLLRVHLIDLGAMVESGADNPFKPGTELSWEADLMVKLMKRGYPIQELPVLVRIAKGVAKERAACEVRQPQPMVAPKQTGNGGELEVRAVGETGQRAAHLRREDFKQTQELTGEWKQVGAANCERLTRGKSINDLDSAAGKQIWAASLCRAKSVPRFIRQTDGGDTDSIDKLITSIENEMSDLLQLEGSELAARGRDAAGGGLDAGENRAKSATLPANVNERSGNLKEMGSKRNKSSKASELQAPRKAEEEGVWPERGEGRNSGNKADLIRNNNSGKQLKKRNKRCCLIH